MSKAKTILLLCGILVTVVCYGQETGDSFGGASAQEYYRLGKESMANSDWRQANEYFKKAEDALDKNSDSQAFVQPKKIKIVEVTVKPQPVKKEIKIQPIKQVKSPVENKKEEIFPEVLIQAVKAADAGKWDEALAFYQKALKKWPRDPKIHFNMGVIYVNKTEYQKAAGSFDRAATLDWNDYESYYNLGVLYEGFLGNKDKAVFYYNKYIKCAPASEERDKVKDWINYIKLQEQ